jgi:Ni,Fe-hydrogenase I cytochrome b subunit
MPENNAAIHASSSKMIYSTFGRIISIRTPFVFSLMVSKRYFTMFAGAESSCEADIFFRKAWYEQAMPANRRICCENSR